MNRDEALVKINEIREIVMSGNKIILSGPRLIGYGAIFLFMPWLTLLLNQGVFKQGIGHISPWLFSLCVIGFYAFLFLAVGSLADRRPKLNPAMHPLLRKAFQLYLPIFMAMAGIIMALNILKQGVLIFPIIFILLGIWFNLIGRFSIRVVYNTSWTYILLGLVFLVLTSMQFRYLHSLFAIYMGITFIHMGIVINRRPLEKSNEE